MIRDGIGQDSRCVQLGLDAPGIPSRMVPARLDVLYVFRAARSGHVAPCRFAPGVATPDGALASPSGHAEAPEILARRGRG
ncbi:hypothetical protein GCM10007977_052060 [Dactylosporangium sucinum]|uniref:Uncharacterized protein n=1 Tax=Dactylosporangium sucinum TaxID=1424081 RepID=A0A917TZ20_9ACTN|nr:hypothetical protein GCM10007977_052060 [Dactylosporangium sucinum]